MFRDGHRNLFYFGGGVNYWAAPSLGLRLEFRDHVSNDPAHFWSSASAWRSGNAAGLTVAEANE
jgi:hypothetical protein